MSNPIPIPDYSTRTTWKINDAELLKAEQILLVYLNRMALAAAMYIDAMTIVRDTAINDGAGNIASACENKAAMMNQTILPMLLDARNQLEGKADEFIHEIDRRDNFVYGRVQ